jgi:hypothetical protein
VVAATALYEYSYDYDIGGDGGREVAGSESAGSESAGRASGGLRRPTEKAGSGPRRSQSLEPIGVLSPLLTRTGASSRTPVSLH